MIKSQVCTFVIFFRGCVSQMAAYCICIMFFRGCVSQMAASSYTVFVWCFCGLIEGNLPRKIWLGSDGDRTHGTSHDDCNHIEPILAYHYTGYASDIRHDFCYHTDYTTEPWTKIRPKDALCGMETIWPIVIWNIRKNAMVTYLPIIFIFCRYIGVTGERFFK